MKRLLSSMLACGLLLASTRPALAGYADVPGRGTIVADVSLQFPYSRGAYDEKGNFGNLNEDIVMYDPAGTPLGTISVPAYHYDRVLLSQLFYGFSDDFAAGVIVPYFLKSVTELRLNWTPGAYASDLGRPYSEDDFWRFAGSMGQGKPKDFEAKNRLGDVVLGGLYQVKKTKRYQLGVLSFASTQTGKPGDPEVLGATGTTGYELQSNGDVGLHLLGDYFINPRISVGGEVFYEWFFPRRLDSAMGSVNPLLSYEGKYNGGGYLVVPGDWIGSVVGADFVLLRGTNEPSWITRSNPKLQKTLPALLTAKPQLKYTRFFGNRYRSDSPFFDAEQARLHRSGYRVNVEFQATLNLLRYGAPVGLYYKYADQELIAGRSYFPIVNNIVGLQLFAAF